MAKTQIVEIVCQRCGQTATRHSQAKYCSKCKEIIRKERNRQNSHDATLEVKLARRTARARKATSAIARINGEARMKGLTYGKYVALMRNS